MNRDQASALFHKLVRTSRWVFQGRFGDAPEQFHEPTVDSIKAGDLTLNSLTWPGDGPPVVLLHGLNNSAWIWARVGSILASRHHVVAISQRGHGGSTAPVHGYSLDDTTHDLLTALDALGLDIVHLAGHSWGGKVATHFAANHPDKVRTLTLADPVPPQGLNRVLTAVPQLLDAAYRAERGPFDSLDRLVRQKSTFVQYPRQDELDLRVWLSNFRADHDGRWHHFLPQSGFDEIISQALSEDITGLLSQITAPVLLLLPTFTVSFLPGEIGPFRRHVANLTVRRIWGDHAFVHSNCIDAARKWEAWMADHYSG